MKKFNLVNKWRYLIAGILFGLCFPVIGGIYQMYFEEIPLTLNNFFVLQLNEPLLWIIDMAPLILGIFAFFIGKKQDDLANANDKLEQKVGKQVKDLHDSNSQLKIKIEQQNHTEKKLEEALSKAEQASRAKTEFLSTMSHEIRTPLNAVIGMTSLLLETELSGEQVDFVRTIKVGGESLLSVINDILDYSKIEAGKLELEEQAFNTIDPLEDVADLLGGKVHAKGLELIYDIAENVPQAIYSDLTRLRQVLVNLVGNAIKFTEKGEIHITVKAVGHQDGKDKLLFEVRDTGIGIAPEKLSRLFKSFSQVDASTTRKFGGTGLGLAICKKIVNHMEGEIWVESEQGVGSSFFFYILARQAPARKYQMYDAISLFNGKKVLLLDDNSTNLQILSRQCENWGLKPYCFDKPKEALKWMLDDGDADLIITDMQMPVMDGVEFASHIGACVTDPPPLILLSSLGVSLSGKGKNIFSYVLTKPAKSEQLFNAMARLLGWNHEKSVKDQDSSPNPGLTSLKILLAEDNPVNQKVACHMLRKMSFEADVAGNGHEALELVQQFDYDLILMDMQMPVMDGLEATTEILHYCEENKKAAPVIIAMTASSSSDDRDACLAAGMKDFLSKPVQAKSLQAIIHKWFNAKTASQSA